MMIHDLMENRGHSVSHEPSQCGYSIHPMAVVFHVFVAFKLRWKEGFILLSPKLHTLKPD